MSSLLSVLGTMSSSVLNFLNQQENNRFIREANERNLSLQKEAWAREDNAVQRRMADLKAAGLSPALAAGSAASSSGPSISIDAEKSALSQFGGMVNGIANAIKFGKEQKLLDSQVKLANEEVRRIKEENKSYGYLSYLDERIKANDLSIKESEEKIQSLLVEQMEHVIKHLEGDKLLEWIRAFGSLVPKFQIKL